MKYSVLFPKTLKQNPTGVESVNHQLLVRGGFIDQLMAGSWTLLPLGYRVINKINDTIREELNPTGAQEMLMPLLHPKDIWAKTGRWDNPQVKEIMYQFKDIHNREFALSFTHEEVVMDLVRKYIKSYKDLPIKIYHFSTKFRNEPRAKSGILRGREFLMKDLYSVHASEADMNNYYNQVKDSYIKIFKKIGLEVRVTEAAGGVFTESHTHEFQVITPIGEDIIFYCQGCDFAENKEVFKGKEGDKCHKCGGTIKSAHSIEVGNIFPFGNKKYAEMIDVNYTDDQGQERLVYFASYGIGVTRVMGALVEVSHDDKGIIWPEAVAPFKVHLVGLDMDNSEIAKKAEEIYQKLQADGVEVLFDERLDCSPGEKFADADLIGIPYRVVVSKKTTEKLEVKKRNEDHTQFMSMDELIKHIKA